MRQSRRVAALEEGRGKPVEIPVIFHRIVSPKKGAPDNLGPAVVPGSGLGLIYPLERESPDEFERRVSALKAASMSHRNS